MMKTILVVCNHGNTSQMVSLELKRQMEDCEFLARGALTKVPTDLEISNAAAIILPFDETYLARLESGNMVNSFFKLWVQFYKRIKGKPIFKYMDSKTGDFVDFLSLAGELRKIA